MPSQDTPDMRMRKASREYAAGHEDKARALLQGLAPPTKLTDRAAYTALHRSLGQPQTDIEDALNVALSVAPTTPQQALDHAQALFFLDRPDALEAAQAAVDMAEGAEAPTLLLLKMHLDADRPDAATDSIFEAAKTWEKPGGLLLAAAKILGQGGHKDHAIKLLDAAEPYQQANLAEFDFVSAGIKGTQPAKAEQSDMAEAIFDKFAGDYDKVLASIGYSAPEMIADLLKTLHLKKMKRLQVLDAGCGTGLCAKILRPYAKVLHGADISAAMLEKAKKRKLYNGLTRSDLNAPATIPEGPFDLVVLADVLIYFGDLAPVLAALSQRLSPGGWLLLTVENEASLPAPGFRLGASGRYKHAEDHVTHALKGAGLGRPKHMFRKTLRHEFGMPIEGMAVAAQKPVLAF